MTTKTVRDQRTGNAVTVYVGRSGKMVELVGFPDIAFHSSPCAMEDGGAAATEDVDSRRDEPRIKK